MLESNKNSHKIEIIINPFSKYLYNILSLQMYEEIGGQLAHGKASLIISGVEDGKQLLTDTIEGTIELKNKLENGISYNIPIVITSRAFVETRLDITFVCSPSKAFYTNKIIETYENIDEAIACLTSDYTKLKHSQILTETDTSKFVPLSQESSTKYEFLKRIALGYKNKAIIGFGFQDFFIRDVEKESNRPPILLGPSGINKSATNNLIYAKDIIYNNPEILNEDSPSNYKAISTYALSTQFFGGGYEILGKNYLQNQIYYKTAKQNSFKITNLEKIPEYKLGDTVLVIDKMNKENILPKRKYLVWSNEMFIRFNGADFKSKEGSDYSWSTTLVGLEDGNWSNVN